jgi:hypothetical protein
MAVGRWTPLALLLLSLGLIPLGAQPPQAAFRLAPALALEAEDFQIESGWKVVQNGHGNYMVDAVGFNHISGERLLCTDGKDETASAFLDVNLPEAGKYRLWVRYEYPAFCETRFRVQVEQDGKAVIDHLMGAKDNPRYAFGEPEPRAQHDPSWGSEGLAEEVVTTPELKAGKARLYLKAIAQPQVQGVTAGRHIDLVYMTRDLDDAWIKHYRKQTNLYPILDAFRDSRGPRYEVRFTNKSGKPADFSVAHVYNRVPWGNTEGVVAKQIAPEASSDWIGLKVQDTTHFGLVSFSCNLPLFDVEIRPVGGAVEKRLPGPGPQQVYLPPYPGKGDKPVTPLEAIEAVLKDLETTPTIGKKPTLPLCYGGWLPLGQPNDYGRAYARLYAALGFRSLHPAHSGPHVLKNLEAVGVPPTKSWAVSGYRNPPLTANIEQAKREAARSDMDKYLLWYDYGDEIAFSEWMGLVTKEEVERVKKVSGREIKPEQVTARLWVEWLRANRPGGKPQDYWLEKWGEVDANRLRPDSGAEAARLNPRLYVDSLLFYEDTAIKFAAEGARAVRAALGDDVLCGANWSCHPFYYPPTTMYVKWFRGSAADVGRHSEYFWQVGQPGPMVNGYIAEHFRCGLRDNPRGVLRQYTMPHSPGNTDASFLRSAFTHLAHGATRLDFFGVGMNDTFTENHIDHRDRARYRALRDVTHAVGLVEDLLPESRPVPSPVALLVSASTERWDFAGIAEDGAGLALFGKDFRKVRLNAHIDRLGLWTALTFLGASPDLIVEEDVNEKVLHGYKVLVVVGDCLPPHLAPTLGAWVRDGGVLLATANAGRYDEYREPAPVFQQLFGLETRRTQEKSTFFRPRQELPFLKPLNTVQGPGWVMPQLGTEEHIGPGKGVEVLARFKDGDDPAVTMRRLGKGRVFYSAALPGVAYLLSALQPPQVPDRGPNTHTVPTAFDAGARALLAHVLDTASVERPVTADPPLIDARLLRAPKGHVLPLANYNEKLGQKVEVRVRLGDAVKKVTSAYHGELPFEQARGVLTVTLPALGAGDVLRLDP